MPRYASATHTHTHTQGEQHMVMRPCNIPGCTNVTRYTRCQTHQQQHQRSQDTGRGTAASRGYDTTWRRLAARILTRDRHTCRWCGQPATSVDHLIPKIEGGTDDEWNLCASCITCNSRRAGQLTQRRQRMRRQGVNIVEHARQEDVMIDNHYEYKSMTRTKQRQDDRRS